MVSNANHEIKLSIIRNLHVIIELFTFSPQVIVVKIQLNWNELDEIDFKVQEARRLVGPINDENPYIVGGVSSLSQSN